MLGVPIGILIAQASSWRLTFGIVALVAVITAVLTREAECGKKAAEELGARYVLLDVTDTNSVNAAATEIMQKEGRIDVLINNAGITGAYKKPEDITVDDIRQTYETNVFGIVRVTHAFIPLLRNSESPVIVNVSSGLGSFGMVTNPDTLESKINALSYTSSKSAVTMLSVQYAKGLTDIRVNAVDPGPTKTDFPGQGHQTVQEGTDAIIRMATIGKHGPTGTFTDRKGTIPW